MRDRKQSRTAVLFFGWMLFVSHAEVVAEGQAEDVVQAGDHRQLITMPAEVVQLMRTDMRDHMAAMNEVLGFLADGDLETASEIAETRLGKSSMGKHRATGMGPGRFMPLEMRNIGWGMHESASEFAEVAKGGDTGQAYQAFRKVTASCVACHHAYRVR